METFPFSQPINLVEEGKWFLAVTSFEAKTSVFNITNETKSFSISTPRHWSPQDGENLINEPNKLLELRSENDIELNVKEVAKRGTRIEVENIGYNLAGFRRFKSDILSALRRVKYKDLEDMVYKLQLDYDEFIDILEVKYIAG